MRKSTTISERDVRYIASLSRIHLRDEEINQLTKDLEKILGYFAKLATVDITGIEPTSHVLPIKNVFRKDKSCSSLKQNEVLKLTVEQRNGFFKVPKVIE